MTFLGFLLLLLIAAIAGAIGQALAGYTFGGWIVTTIVGFVGAYVGTFLANQFHLPSFFVIQVESRSFPLFWAIVGSAVLAGVASLLTRGGRSI